MENETTIKRNIPRDLFLHLLAIVALYWSAISFLNLLWRYIDKYIQDNLTQGYYDAPPSVAVASLIIIFPIFIWTSWYLNKIYSKNIQVRESGFRKWLIYITLFIATMIIIGDLVTVISVLLNGEIISRFTLKAVSILIVVVLIFGYYLDDVRRDSPTKLAKPFAWIASILVFCAVVGSFIFISNPVSARLAQFDQQKVSDLQNIQYQVVYYYQSKQKLPATLADLTDDISGFKAPIDPQIKANYVYNIKNAENLSFELCANFNKPSQKEDSVKPLYPTRVGEISQNWDHPSGEYCFQRTIDPQFYPPFSKTK